jgi:anthranilate synthase/aminodeoxychorismate synthase-like glutamine amidotransferase
MASDILLIDNKDSFTFNLVESFRGLGAKVKVLRNDVAAQKAVDLARREKRFIVISPGPGRPEDAGSILDIIRLAKGTIPLLGVCLGHQAIVAECGGEVSRAQDVVHGKSWSLEHDSSGPFAGMPTPLRVGRYHSLCTPNPPKRFTVHGWIGDMAMAISDREARQYGVQFHPESLLTPRGDLLLQNLLGAMNEVSEGAF